MEPPISTTCLLIQRGFRNGAESISITCKIQNIFLCHLFKCLIWHFFTVGLHDFFGIVNNNVKIK